MGGGGGGGGQREAKRTDHHAAAPPSSAGRLQQTQLSSFHTRLRRTGEQFAPRHTAVPATPPAPPPREHHCWSSLLELTAAAHWTRGSPQSESDGRKRRQEAVTRGNYFISCSFPLLQVSTKKECTILTTGGRGEGEGVSKGLLSLPPSLPPVSVSTQLE